MPEVVGLITARAGSKGIPGKNVKILAGVPMVGWTLKAAQQSSLLSRLLVSTDDPVVAGICREQSVEVPFVRPPELAEDTTPHIDVINHALTWLEHDSGLPDYLFLLQPTSPLRTGDDIDAAIELALKKDADAVIGVSLMHPHPFLAKRIGKDQILMDLFPSVEEVVGRRQSMPPAYGINGAVYVNRCTSLKRDQTLFPSGAFAYLMPPERSLDVDSPLEFFLVEQLLRHARALP